MIVPSGLHHARAPTLSLKLSDHMGQVPTADEPIAEFQDVQLQTIVNDPAVKLSALKIHSPHKLKLALS
jgi:hypothetical protein